MVDNIENGGFLTLTQSSSFRSLQSAPDTKEKPAKKADSLLKEPAVKIAEVASKASAEKVGALDSLEQMASDLREAIQTLNSALERSPTKAIITRDETLNRFVVKIQDKSSGEVVREIPSEALLNFARNLQELKGLIFDESL
jgi:flagellar protein FlaG